MQIIRKSPFFACLLPGRRALGRLGLSGVGVLSVYVLHCIAGVRLCMLGMTWVRGWVRHAQCRVRCSRQTDTRIEGEGETFRILGS